ncbi:CRISPR-associated endonuclease Cas2 [Domibacillus indicus]|uniref:CRISPR-associated endonuclease Cas2 n=1 Tax=Domibacillus indicus TaxID=1437523 RepID=UPI000617EA19|nr:CRISPR-associated endonuclease Cas2 [Domibacillus indicus]
MYVIITYDVNEKRTSKMCKKLRAYLDWTQNSVFEGEITKGKLQECLASLEEIMGADDSLYVYQIANPKHLKKVTYGSSKNDLDLFL